MKYSFKVLFIISILFLFCCSEDDKDNDAITTDISISTTIGNFGWIDYDDLISKLDAALTVEYGYASQNEVEKTFTFNSDTTNVVATISFKDNIGDKYADQQSSNNSVEIILERGIPELIEGLFGDYYNIASPPWENCQITYSFLNYTQDISEQEQIEAFDSAAQKWANIIDGLSITNLGFNNSNANILISFTNYLTHSPCPTSFENEYVVAHAFFPNVEVQLIGFEGDIHFNDNVIFTDRDTFFPRYDFETVALHELGHSLGLNHSDYVNTSAIMHEEVLPFFREINLTQSDIDGFNELYNNTSCSDSSMSHIEITPNSWAFSDTQINSSSQPKEFTITNTGNTNFNISNISSTNNAFVIVNGQSATIQAGNSIELEIQFLPTEEQSYSGSIIIENDADNGDGTIYVSGNGINDDNTYVGNVILLTQQEVDDFASNNYTSIIGNLYFGEQNNTNDIDDISGFNSLLTINGDCQLHVINTQLTSLEGLNNVYHINGSINIAYNDILNDISQLSNITSLSGLLQVYDCDSLTNLNGLNNIQSINGFVSINYNDNLTQINLTNLESCGTLELYTNESISNLNGLSNLENVTDLYLANNNSLNDFCGLSNLISNNGVNGAFTIYGNQYNPTQQDLSEGNCSN